MDVVFCENEAIDILVKCNLQAGKFVKTIICSEPDAAKKAKCLESEINLFWVDELLQTGREIGKTPHMKEISSDSVYIIM